MIKFLYPVLGFAATLGFCAGAVAQAPSKVDSPFVVSGDGQEVTDTSTGLVWRRCAEGARWDGHSCSGIAETYNYAQALGRVDKALDTQNKLPTSGPSNSAADGKNSQPSNGTAWRLPTVYELSSITDRRFNNPTIDSAAFPNTPANWYWSSTSDTNNPSYIWIISFYSGYASNIGPYNKGQVRLVRDTERSQS